MRLSKPNKGHDPYAPTAIGNGSGDVHGSTSDPALLSASSDALKDSRRGRSAAALIPFSSLVAPGVVMGRQGELMATFELGGLPFETADEADLKRSALGLNTLYRTVGSEGLCVMVHRVRSKSYDALSTPAGDNFAAAFARDYNAHAGGEGLMEVKLYLTLVMKENPRQPRKRRSKDEIASRLKERLLVFEQLCANAQSNLKRFEVRRLAEYEEHGVEYSELLSFYVFLLSGRVQKVRVPGGPLYEALSAQEYFSGADTLEVQGDGKCRFVQCVEIKDFAHETFCGVLDALLYPAAGAPTYAFVETQSFCFLGRNESVRFLKLQQRQLSGAQDASASQIEQMSAALDGVASGDFALGEYSYVLSVWGESEAQVRLHTQDVLKKLQDEGYLPYVSTRALTAAFFSQLPGAFALRPRVAKLTSLNFAELAPLHNIFQGKREGNPWGEAVALMKTPSGQPYFFNFHLSGVTEQAQGKKYLGNTVVLGTSGSGKTVTLNALLTLAQKYREDERFSCVYFDKDRGAEIAIRALGGGYYALKNGERTGFNPLQLPDTPENRQFMLRLLKLLIGGELTAMEEQELSDALDAVLQMPRELRRLSLIPQNLTEGLTRSEQENSLSRRLRRWVEEGDLAWVFDNERDELSFNAEIFGIDGTQFLSNPEVSGPVSFYLLQRMEELLDGRRLIFVMDEFWQWLSDPVFKEFAKNKLKTIRKQNGLGIFATQSPSDVLESDIAKAVIEQCATQVLLPNPRADEQEYKDGLKLTDAEFEILKGLSEGSRCMLVKQGQRSALCSFDLSWAGPYLKVFSGSTENIHKVEALMQKHGPEPDKWLAEFMG
ncbi:MAG: VirB4 family type IV secretion/conjugal transfer ATPase [Succinivibrio sp.]|nr:VirB4 family type IV secretion/conjugal transfer ATPase [Succinivibrio sp.]